MASDMSPIGSNFHRIELELTGSAGMQFGDPAKTLAIVAPLDERGKIDVKSWENVANACKAVARKDSKDSEERVGCLVHEDNGVWKLHYDGESFHDEEDYIFGSYGSDQRFIPGGYVVIFLDQDMHTYRVRVAEALEDQDQAA